MNDFDMKLCEIRKLALEIQQRHGTTQELIPDLNAKLRQIEHATRHCRKYLDCFDKYGMRYMAENSR